MANDAHLIVIGLLAIIVVLGLVAGLRGTLLWYHELRTKRRRIASATKQEVALAAAVRTLPESAYEDANVDGIECTICLSVFELGSSIRLLPCGHCFHTACIDAWLLHRSDEPGACTHAVPRCPLCKATPLTKAQLQKLQTVGFSAWAAADGQRRADLIANPAQPQAATVDVRARPIVASSYEASPLQAVGHPGSLLV